VPFLTMETDLTYGDPERRCGTPTSWRACRFEKDRVFAVMPARSWKIRTAQHRGRQGHGPASSSGPFNESPTQGTRMTFSAPTGYSLGESTEPICPK